MEARTNIRPASKSDIEFIIEGIIEAGKGGGQIIPTAAIFKISLGVYKQHLRKFFKFEEVENCEYDLSTYLIAEINKVPVGSLSYWVEGLSTIGSKLIKLNCWMASLGTEKFQNTLQRLELAKKYDIKRLKNYLQLEYLYVSPLYRTRGLHNKLIKTSINNILKLNQKFLGCQVILFKENIPSYNFFKKRGFKENQIVKIQSDAQGIIFHYPTKISMILERDNLPSFLKNL
jgi:Acetyltransferase (GNAT) family